METTDTKELTQCRYQIEGLYIVDTKNKILNGKPIHIRKLLDSECGEYQSCKITDNERLDIIGSLGLKTLIPVLDECFKSGNKGYNTENVVTFTVYFLMVSVYPGLHCRLVENDSKTKLLIQLMNYKVA